ncbi:MAG: hypothetical protein G01um101448_270 [Parcubacteria group bacterium Gr01-1014_48]|nr:MAG: hypothetical protein Greene041614_294 [Parcubacteria group bacterium Greene0416_14]TSC74219.1 MAG: hypothetical protein G01um101448_270 [Parcubacteria group bacterium Gr01-1014_48]TSD01723.1 MAG: hypothetical protein Greene101415_121 [Parcubacteria group bacterium Greene1014_15]TSD07793.1 MAG: hypothetical protein Greene07144_718 [Parcubacteria group bacterium Greene0714_4]
MTLVQKYRMASDAFIDSSRAAFEEDCRHRTFRSIIEMYVQKLSRQVVSAWISPNAKPDFESLKLMRVLGNVHGRSYFFDERKRCFYVQTETVSGDSVFVFAHIVLSNEFTEAIKEVLLGCIENHSADTEEQDEHIIVPTGLYVFEYSAQFGVGGYEDDETECSSFVEAITLDEAIQKLMGMLKNIHGNCTRNFRVHVAGGTTKRLLIKYNSMPATSMFQGLLERYRLVVDE